MKRAGRVPVGPLAALALVAQLALVVGGALAEESTETRASNGQGFAYELGRELMSPFCPGRTISSCPSDQAAELLQWMVLQEAAGASREDVVTLLEERFGPGIHSAPEADGWGLAAWLLPVGLLALGAGVVAVVLRRMVGGAKTASPGERAPSPSTAPPASHAAPTTADASDVDLERLVDAEFAASER